MRSLLFLSLLAGFMLVVHCTSGPQDAGTTDDATVSTSTEEYRFPSYNPQYPPPPGFKNTFSLSQDYPTTYDANAAQPWTKIDFKTDFKGYLETVLDYCMEGNLEVDFDVEKNKVRKWYETPWMHNDGTPPGANKGREYRHGLTKEIEYDPYVLHKLQKDSFQIYAVAFYNEPGGVTIGKVWSDPENPDPSKSEFPEGTVCFKLLMTEAPLEQVPFLENSKEWTANIYPKAHGRKGADFPKKEDKIVRLLQLDIAIKDKRAEEVGWVTGTFVYDASQKGTTWRERMVPVGLMWGDDSGDTTMMNRVGAFENPSLKQSVLNQSLIYDAKKQYTNQAYVLHHGLGGRMNGPVDTPASSCNSCHARAAVDKNGGLAPLLNYAKGQRPQDYNMTDFNRYFENISCGVETYNWNSSSDSNPDSAFVKYTTTDFSFQLAFGINRFHVVQQNKRREMEQEAHDEDPIELASRNGGH